MILVGNKLNAAKVSEVLKELLGDIFFLVEKTNFNRRNSSLVNVCFSDLTDVDKILAILNQHCQLHPSKSATRLVHNSTKIRINILETIAQKVQEKNWKKLKAVLFQMSIRSWFFLLSSKNLLSTPNLTFLTPEQFLISTIWWCRKTSKPPWLCAKRTMFQLPKWIYLL